MSGSETAGDGSRPIMLCPSGPLNHGLLLRSAWTGVPSPGPARRGAQSLSNQRNHDHPRARQRVGPFTVTLECFENDN